MLFLNLIAFTKLKYNKVKIIKNEQICRIRILKETSEIQQPEQVIEARIRSRFER